jgi:hypothetical protein
MKIFEAKYSFDHNEQFFSNCNCLYFSVCLRGHVRIILTVLDITVMRTSVCADVILSGIGTIVWTAALITWITIFQLHRAEWGATADQISFIIPTGIP